MTESLVVLWNWDFFIVYFEWIFFRIPPELIYIHLLIVLIGLSLICYSIQPYKKRLKYSSLLILLGYISLVICSTLILRESFDDYRYELIPFWSYYAYVHRDSQLLTQIYLNILLFVPIGLLLGISLNHKGVIRILFIGVEISFLIECCQLIFKKGIFEFDDMFHNTLGCLIGYLIYKIAKLLINKIGLLCQILKTKPC